MQDDSRSTSHSRSKPSTGPHVHTNEATRTSLTAATLRREERVAVQGPGRKPTKDKVPHRGGGDSHSPRVTTKWVFVATHPPPYWGHTRYECGPR